LEIWRFGDLEIWRFGDLEGERDAVDVPHLAGKRVYQRNVTPTVPRQKSKLLNARSNSSSGSLSCNDRK
jgi:hypothetical protein